MAVDTIATTLATTTLMSNASRKAGRVKALTYHSKETPFGGKIAAGLGSIEVTMTMSCGAINRMQPASASNLGVTPIDG